MKKIIQRGVMMVFCLIFMLPFLAKADGFFIPPPDYYIGSNTQRAVIIHENGIETLIVSTQFKGDAVDFGWVIPTPSRPEVSKSSDELFTSLDDLTTPAYTAYDRGLGLPMAAEKSAQKEAVTVLETKRVGIYEIKVLEANDAQALANWMADNKYMYPKQGAYGAYILEEYVQKGWFFIAAKVDTRALTGVQTAKSLIEGHATPLKLTFKSDKIIYPMKVSSIQTSLAKSEEQKAGDTTGAPMTHPYYYSDEVSILIYIFAGGKKEAPGFNVQYAGNIKPKEIEKLAYVEGESWWKPNKKFYLTRLSRYMAPSEMTEDIVFRPADDNKPVGGEKTTVGKILTIALSFLITFLIWVFSLIGLVFIIFSFIRRAAQSKITNTVSAVFQWISFVCSAIAYVVYLLIIGENGFFGEMLKFKDADLGNWGAVIFGFAAVVVMLVILLTQRARYKKIKDTLK